MEMEEGNILPIGKVLLTNVGLELVNVCKVPGVEGFEDFVKGKWKNYLPEEKEIQAAG